MTNSLMPAVAIAGESADFVDLKLPRPRLRERDLLVRVIATSINPIDLKLRRRAGSPTEPLILGFDAVGIVEHTGARVTAFHPGDRVYYAGVNNRPGTNAAYHAVDERLVALAPATLSDAEAAAFPLVSLTAWEVLFERLGLTGDSSGRLLVLGGAGGVASQIIQLARALTGLEVIATASREESRQWVRSLGAHRVIDHSAPLTNQLGDSEITAAFSSYTSGRTAELAEVLAPQSRLVLIDDPTDFAIGDFKAKSITVGWESMFTRARYQTPDMADQGRILQRVADLLNTGRIQPITTAVLNGLSAATIREGHAQLESGRQVGKLSVVY